MRTMLGGLDGRFLGAALSGSQANQKERGDDEPVSHTHDARSLRRRN